MNQQERLVKRNFRSLLERNRWLKGVPNALTLCNSLCGFGAILYTLLVYDTASATDRGIEDILAVSAWMILGAMVFDALDGFAARILNAASMHGLQMDSLADMVTFGVAPATVVAVMAHSMPMLRPYSFMVVWGLCAIYLGCAALRLATYNVHAIVEKKSSDKFSGLPSPGAAAAICSLVIFYSTKHGEIKQIVTILPIYAAILGLLMVSKVPYLHFGKWLFSVRKSRKRMAVLLLIVIALIWSPTFTPVALINGYILWGPIAALAAKLGLIKPAGQAEEQKAPVGKA